MDQRKDERRYPREDRNREQEAADEEAGHPLIPRRVINLLNPCLVTPRSSPVRARWPPFRTSAARTKRSSKVRRASSRHQPAPTGDVSNGGGKAVGGTTPRVGQRTTRAASTFWSSRTLPGQS